MPRQIFICQEGEHNKYWIIEKDPTSPSTVLVKNGRLGAEKGQIQKPNNRGTERGADRYIEEKIDEKKRLKGYYKITEQQFAVRSRQASIVGLQNKCSGLAWIEALPYKYLDEYQCYKKVPDSRLADPAYDPVLIVNLSTRKEYAGRVDFKLLFTPDATFEITGSIGSRDTHCDFAFRTVQVTPGHPLHELTEKVEAGLSLMV